MNYKLSLLVIIFGLIVLPACLYADAQSNFGNPVLLWEGPIGSAVHPKICTVADSNVYVVWSVMEGLYFSQSHDAGGSFENARRLEDINEENGYILSGVDIAADSMGKLIIVYTVYDINTFEFRLFSKSSTDDGATFETREVFSVEAGISASMLFGSALKIVDDIIYYVWSGGVNTYLARSFDGGGSFEILPVFGADEMSTSGVHIYPSIAVNSNQDLFMAWFKTDGAGVEHNDGLFDLFFTRLDAGQSRFSEPRLIAQCDSWMGAIRAPKIFAASNGELLVLWNKAPGMSADITVNPLYSMRSSDMGDTFSAPVELTFDTHDTDIDPQVGQLAVWLMSAFMDEQDVVHLIYSQTGPLYYTESSDFLSSFGPGVQVSDWGYQSSITVNQKSDVFITWSDENDADSDVSEIYFAGSSANASDEDAEDQSGEGNGSGGGGCFISGLRQ